MTEGLKETHELYDAVEAVIVWWDVSQKDGSISGKDLIAAAPLLIKLYAALKGIDKIPEELKAATAEECQALAQKGVDLLITSLRALMGDKVSI